MTEKEFEKWVLSLEVPGYCSKEDRYVMARFKSVEDFRLFMEWSDPKRLLKEMESIAPIEILKETDH